MEDKESRLLEHAESYEFDNRDNDDKDARLIDTVTKLKSNSTLTKLELKHFVIHDEGARALGLWLEQNTMLKILKLLSSRLGPDGARELANGLKHNSSLTQLDVGDNIIADEGTQWIAQSLVQNTSINHLNSSANTIGNKGARWIAQTLVQNSSLTYLDMHFNSIHSEGAKWLAEGLKHNSSLAYFSIGGNNIRDEGAREIAESLKHNSSLTYLDISWNNIGNEGAREIAESLKHNSSLTHLFIGGNKIGCEGAKEIAEGLKHNSSLTHLGIDANKIGNEGAREIAKSLKHNSSLIHLDLNNIHDIDWTLLRKAAKLNGRIEEISTFSQEKFQPINTQRIVEFFVDFPQVFKMPNGIKSESEKLWCDRITFFDESIGQLSIKTGILPEILKMELKAQSTKLNSPVTVLLDGASSAVASALLTDLKRPFVVLSHIYDHKSFLNLLHRCNDSQIIVLIQNVKDNIEAVKSFLQQVKESNIGTRSLTIIAITEESTSNITTLFDNTIKVRFDSTGSIYEYLLATVYMSKHSTISVEQLQSLAERFAGFKKQRGSGLIAQLKNSLRTDSNISPADIDSIFIEASILSLTRGLNVPSVTLADVESVLEKLKAVIYQGNLKSIELITIKPQDNMMKYYFNFLLKKQRIHVEWIDDEITKPVTVSVAKLINSHYEILKHLHSIDVPQSQIWCYRLRVDCDAWTWELGKHVIGLLPQPEKNDPSIMETTEMLLKKENEHLREEVKQIEKYKQEYNAALRLVKRSISDFPYDELVFEEQIGEGSFGNVRRALWHNQKVAIKRFKLDSIESPMTVLDEAKILAHIRHKHIVLLMGTTTIPGTSETMLVLEYMKHGSLHDLLMKKKVKLERSEVIQLATDIAKGLDHLHSMTPKIIHRDLKPQNILLYQKGKRAKLTDFGTAKWFNKDTILSSGVGTIGFMAPELLAWNPNCNEKVDIFSFGVVLLQMVSGVGMPITMEKAREQHINDKIKSPTLADLKQLVLDCCKEDPKKRPSISDIVKRLKSMK